MFSNQGGGFTQPPDYIPPRGPDMAQSGVILELQTQVARQHLMIQTLCRILIAKGVLEEKELDEWFSYMDSLDGRADGKLAGPRAPQACPACRRMNPPRAIKCQYCNHEFPAAFLTPIPQK